MKPNIFEGSIIIAIILQIYNSVVNTLNTEISVLKVIPFANT